MGVGRRRRGGAKSRGSRRSDLLGIPDSFSGNVVDRTQCCPFLIRCYWKLDANNAIDAYSHIHRDEFPRNEILIYSWLDATLAEISSLVAANIDQNIQSPCEFNYNVVFYNPGGDLTMRKLGTCKRENAVSQNEEEYYGSQKTLAQLGYIIGSLIDVSLTLSS